MANKRQLKKSIHRACNDLAFACFISACSVDALENDTIDSCLTDIQRLKEQALAAASFSFDKSSSEFANRKEYNKARSKYFAEAYRKFSAEFGVRLQEIVDKINASLPLSK